MTAAQKIAALEQAIQMLDRTAELIESQDENLANHLDYIAYTLGNKLNDLTEQEISG